MTDKHHGETLSFQADPALVRALGRVAVFMGGDSAEREVSLKSGQVVLAALQSAGVDAYGVDVRGCLLKVAESPQYDRVFIALHGRGGEDGTLQAILAQAGIPYTGSGVSASAIGMDKLRTKLIWSGLGLPTPDFKSVTSSEGLDGVLESMGGAVMVKPPHEGSSIGMSRATTEAELVAAHDASGPIGHIHRALAPLRVDVTDSQHGTSQPVRVRPRRVPEG